MIAAIYSAAIAAGFLLGVVSVFLYCFSGMVVEKYVFDALSRLLKFVFKADTARPTLPN